MHVLADPVIGRKAVDEVTDLVRNITALPRIDELTRLIVPPPRAPGVAKLYGRSEVR